MELITLNLFSQKHSLPRNFRVASPLFRARVETEHLNRIKAHKCLEMLQQVSNTKQHAALECFRQSLKSD